MGCGVNANNGGVILEEFKESQFSSPRWFVVDSCLVPNVPEQLLAVGCEVFLDIVPKMIVGHDYWYVAHKDIVAWRENNDEDANGE